MLKTMPLYHVEFKTVTSLERKLIAAGFRDMEIRRPARSIAAHAQTLGQVRELLDNLTECFSFEVGFAPPMWASYS
jgi:hypothetical protein